MKTNFLPQLQMNPLLAIPAAQAVIGLGQSLFSGKRKAQKEMEDLAKNSPIYTGGNSILDNYNRALQRASTGLTDTAAYKTQMQNLGAGTSQGINALQDRRGALSGVGALIAGQNRGQQNAVVNAEQEQGRRFSQLFGAAQAKTGEEGRRYQLNQLNPYSRQFELSKMKAAAAANTQETGIQNVFGAGATAAGMLGDGNNKFGSTSTSTPRMAEQMVSNPLMPKTLGAVDRRTPNAMQLSFGRYGTAPSNNVLPYTPPAYNNPNYNWFGQ